MCKIEKIPAHNFFSVLLKDQANCKRETFIFIDAKLGGIK